MADWRRVVEVNLFGAFDCARHALARMLAPGRGVILNISSVHEVIPWSGYSAYTSSKAALAMMTKTLAQEAAPHGVRVLALGAGRDPDADQPVGVGRSGGVRRPAHEDPAGPHGHDATRSRTWPWCCARTSSSYVTGTTVMVDGAMTDYPEFAHGG